MKKISFFFNTLVKSLTSPLYYAEILKAKLSFSLKYFLFLTLLLSLITAIKVAIPVALFDVWATADKVAAQYPADLVVNVHNGQVDINQPLPYNVPVPQEWKENDRENGLQNLVVFDSEQNINSPQDFYDYGTAVLVTEKSVYTAEDENGRNSIKVYEVPQEADFTLRNTDITEWKNKFLNMPLIKNKLYVPAIALFLLIFLVPMMYLFRLMTALLYAAAAYILFALFRKQILHGATLTFGKIFQVSLHTLTLPILLAYLTSFLMPVSPIHGTLYFLIYFVFTSFVLNKVTALKTVSSVTTTKVIAKSSTTKSAAKKKSVAKKK